VLQSLRRGFLEPREFFFPCGKKVGHVDSEWPLVNQGVRSLFVKLR
jgi:hypothetical protein